MVTVIAAPLHWTEMSPSTEASDAGLRVVVLVVEMAIVFIRMAPVPVVVESVTVGLWEMLVSIPTVVAGGESIVLNVAAGTLLEEISAAKVMVVVLIFISLICEFGRVAVLLAEKLVSVLGAFGVVSKAVGVQVMNGAAGVVELE